MRFISYGWVVICIVFICSNAHTQCFDIIGVYVTPPSSDCVNNGVIEVVTNTDDEPDVQVSVAGGPWINGFLIPNLGYGTYHVLARYFDGSCYTSYSSNPVVIADPYEDLITVYVTDVSDCNASNGCIYITTGSSNPGTTLQSGQGQEKSVSFFSYSVDGGQNWSPDSTFCGLPGGNYFVRVRDDQDNCIFYSQSFTVFEPASPSGSVSVIQPSGCGAADGTITLSASGGSPPHQFTINGGNNWSSQASYGDLSPGSYSVGWRNSDGSCPEYQTVYLDDTPAPYIDSYSSQDVTDCNAADGIIDYSAKGGTGNLTYFINDLQAQVSYTNSTGYFPNLASGQYELWVMNSDGSCPSQGPTLFIDEPQAPDTYTSSGGSTSDCGASDGQIVFLHSPGEAQMEYSINGGQNYHVNGGVFNGLSAGTYATYFRYVDGTCVTFVGNVTVSDPEPPNYEYADHTNVTDCGFNNGTITIGLSSPQNPQDYEFSIDGGASWFSNNGYFTFVSPGDYQTMVRNDDETCEISGVIITVVEPPLPSIDSVVPTDATDCDQPDGEIFISASGGTSTLLYSIDNGANYSNNGGNFSGLAIGDYTIRVSNSDGTCVVQGPTVTISEPPEPSISNVTISDITDCDAADGIISIAAENGIGIYEYTIDGGSSWHSNAVFPDLAPGNYNVSVRNADNTCVVDYANNPIILADPPEPVIDQVNHTPITDCFADDGSITITVSAGTGTFDYSIDGGSSWGSNNVFNDLTPGMYNISVRNADGTCQVDWPNSITLSDPPQPQIVSVEVTDITDCDAADGIIDIDATDGIGSFSYSIDDGVTWSSNPVFPDLAPGTYQVQVRNSDATCFVEYGTNIILNDPPLPTIISVDYTDPTDCGAGDGTITIVAGDGTGSYEYSIDDGSSWLPNGGNFTNLSPGSFDIQIRNADGTCPVAYPLTVDLTDPPLPVINSVDYTDPTNCNAGDGTITIQAAAGIGSYEYSIDGGDNWLANGGNFVNLSPDTYTILVRNDDGTCPVNHTATITLADPPEPSIIGLSFTEITDCDAADGTISVTATGGINTYQFSADDGNTWTNTTGNFTNLGPGSYDIWVRNSDGTCAVYYGSAVTLNDPPQPSIQEVNHTPITDCEAADGTISITAFGGTGSYSYSIDDQVSWQNNGGIYSNLAPGTYVVWIRSSNGTCPVAYGTDIVMSDPPLPNIDGVDFTHITDCDADDGTITISASAGTGSFDYSIDGGANWNPSPVFAGLTPGTFDIRVRNADNTCPVAYSTLITLTEPPEPVFGDLRTGNISDCGDSDGFIDITAYEGNQLQYSINGGQDWQSENIFSNLPSGIYELWLRNGDGTCWVYYGQPVTLTEPPQPEYSSVSVTQISDCDASDGIITISAMAGINAFQYSINGGENWYDNATFNNLGPGDYNVYIRNADTTCVVPYGSIITLSDPPLPVITNVQFTPISDCNVADGTITISVSAGTGDFEFSIDNGANWSISNFFNGLYPDTYQVVVRNSDGTCWVYHDVDIIIDDIPEPNIDNIIPTDATDCGANDGTILVQASGGIAPLSYKLDNDPWVTEPLFEGLAPGDYSVSVRNSDGTCWVVYPTQISIAQPPEPVIESVSFTQITDCDASDGSITIVASGGTDTYLYSVDDQATWQSSATVVDLGPGQYQVWVSNATGTCPVAYPSIIQLSDPPAPDIVSVTFTDITDCDASDGTITITADAGTGSFRFSIDGGTTWQNNGGFYLGLAPGTYAVRVQNADGTCIVAHSEDISLQDPPEPVIDEVTFTHISDCDVSDGTLTITASGGTSTYNYSLDGETWQNSNLFENLSPGTYLPRVRNSDGTCVVAHINDITLNQPPKPGIANVSTIAITDCNAADGSITISGAAGIGSYEFSINGGVDWQSDSLFTDLGPGIYDLVIRNDNGTCLVPYHTPVILNDPPQPIISAVDFTHPTDCEAGDGTITITASGGTESFSYSLNGIEWLNNGGVFTNLVPGTYPIWVRNADGTCAVVYQNEVTLTDPPLPVIEYVLYTDISDCNVADGTITVSASAGTNNFSYSIDNGDNWSNTGFFEGLYPGTYQIVVSNSDATCWVYYGTDIVIDDIPEPLIDNLVITDVTDCGANDGNILVEASGGLSPLEYQLNTTSWTSDSLFTDLAPGSYTVSVRNSDGTCWVVYPTTVTISEPTPPEFVSVNYTDISDCEAADGTISITATPGDGPIEYSIDGTLTWHNNAGLFTNVGPATYDIWIRNADTTCPTDYGIPITLSDPPRPVIDEVQHTDITDCAAANGSITILVSDGTGNFEYSINDGQNWLANGGFFTDLAPGTYDIRVRNADGTCEVAHGTSIILSDPPQPQILSVDFTAITDCEAADGTISIQATAGTNAYEYSIDDGVNWGSSNTFSDLGPGSYDVAIRNDNGTCVVYSDNTIVLADPPLPVIDEVSSTPITDCGAADGTITISASGGTVNLQYSVDGGSSWATHNIFSGLAPDIYTIWVRNADETCLVIHSVDIVLADPPEPDITNVQVDAITDCSAADGTITISANGGSGPLEYSVNGGASWSVDPHFPDLSPGSYPVQVRNSDGTCIVAYSPVIELNDPPQPSISGISFSAISDCAAADGSINISASGGIGTYTYSIDGGDQFYDNGGDFTNLGPGTYQIVIRNSDGTCAVTHTESIILADPPQPQFVSVVASDATDCAANDGTITIQVEGGTGAFAYSIDEGNSWQTNGGNYLNLIPAAYFVWVRNADGTCVNAYPDPIVINEPPQPTIEQVNHTNPDDCGANNGTITILVADGTGSFEYSIDNGVSWSGQAVFSGLSPNSYQIQVRNSDGTCIVAYPDIVLLSDPPQPVITAVNFTDITDCGAEDGAINIAATDGTGSFSYSINGGEDFFNNDGNFMDLGPGAYDIRVRNADGTCVVSHSMIIVLNDPPQPVITSVSFTQITDCDAADGSITVSASAGTGDLVYSIDEGSTFTANGGIFTDLGPAIYNIAVQNADGTCVVYHSVPVELDDPPAPSIISVSSTDPTDCGANDGTISVQATGGTGNLLYSVDNGQNFSANSGIFTDLSPDTYQIVVQNDNGTCPVSHPVTINLNDPPQPLIVEVSYGDISDCNAADGSITVTADGGTGTYSYSIDGGQNWGPNNTFINLSPATYIVQVRNSDGTCFVEHPIPVMLEDPPAPIITEVTFTDITDCGAADGTISINATDGTGVYEYSVDNGNTWSQSAVLIDLAPNTYVILVRNNDGTCVVEHPVPVMLSDPPEPQFESVSFTNITDCEAADGSISIVATAGTGDFLYSIDGGTSWQDQGQFSNLGPNSYTILISNSNGTCPISYTETLELADPPRPQIDAVVVETISDCQAADGRITITASAGTHTFEYSIDGGNTWSPNNQFIDLPPGNYTVYVRNSNETCPVAYSEVIVLQDPPQPSITEVLVNPISDCGANDGGISIIAADGTGSFNYSINGGNDWSPNGAFSNLTPDTYIIAVRNSNGTCLVTYSEAIIISDPPSPSIVQVESTAISDCGASDGSISITAEDGIGSYQYSIDGGASWHPNATFLNLDEGIYTIQIRNADETCPITYTETIDLSDPPSPVILNVVVSNISDCGADDGTITIVADGGIGSYEYSLDGQTWFVEASFNDLAPGDYTPWLRNATGTCPVVAPNTVTLAEPSLPQIDDVISSPITDCEAANASIAIIASGGSGVYDYSINGGTTWLPINQFDNLGEGSYTVWVRNRNSNCISTYPTDIVFADPPAPSIDAVAAVDPDGCGVDNGTILIAVNGGTGSFNYSINGGLNWDNTDGNFLNLGSGTYQILVRNADGTCEVGYAEDIILEGPETPQILSVDFSNPTTCGGSDGLVSIQAIGNGALQYSINDGVSWEDDSLYTALPDGNYFVWIRNADGTCPIPYSGNVTLSSPQPPVVLDVQTTDISDCGVADGTIQVIMDGNPTQYEYQLNDGDWLSTNGLFFDLAVGTYTLSVRNLDQTCETTYPNPLIIGGPDLPEILAVSANNPGDCSSQNGSILIIATGSSGPLEYSIDNGQSWSVSGGFNNLPAGDYQIIVRYQNETCAVAYPDLISLTAPASPLIEDVLSSNPSNCDLTDGTIQVIASGGTGALQYSINGGTSWSDTGNFANLPAGDYFISVSNEDGSCVQSYPTVISLTAPVAPEIISVTADSPSDCALEDGTLSIAATGTGPLLYSVDAGDNWQDSPTFPNLPEGTYYIVIANADGTCQVSHTEPIVLSSPSGPEITTVDLGHPTNCGSLDGTITIVSQGGTNLQYSIDGAIWLSNNGIFTNLPAGLYFPAVRNADGSCVFSANSVTLDDPASPQIDGLSASNATLCGTDNGSIQINASGGIPPLQFSIDGVNWVANDGTFINLAPGVYTASVRNSDGSCLISHPQSITVQGANGPEIDNVEFTHSGSCTDANGTILITASGGQAPLEYSIDGATWLTNDGIFTTVSPGTYLVAVRNSDGTCVFAFSEPVVIQGASEPIISSVEFTDPSACDALDGSIQIFANAGQPPLEYSLDGSNWQSDSIFPNLGAGIYAVYVRNSDETCVVLYPEMIELMAPTGAQIISVEFTHPGDCAGTDGTIIVTTQGGISPLAYTINGGATWLSNNGSFTGLENGSYQVGVRNADGSCEVFYPNNVVLQSPSAPAIQGVDVANSSTCDTPNGSIQIHASGGSGTLEYSIDNGQTYYANNGVFTGLGMGTYIISVRNENGSCAIFASQPAIIEVPTAASIVSVTPISPSNCAGTDGRIYIQTSGGSGTLQFSIDGGANYFSNGGLFANLSMGAYNIVVQNEDGSCAVPYTETVFLTDPPAPMITDISSNNPSDCGAADGSITIAASGGTDLRYSIDGGNHWFAYAEFGGLDVGTYDVRVRNADGSCPFLAADVVILSTPNVPLINSLTAVDPSSCDSNDGSLEIFASGLAADFLYSIDGGVTWQEESLFENLGIGLYSIQISNADSSCAVFHTEYVQLTIPDAPQVTGIEFSSPTDCQALDGMIQITTTGDADDFSYSVDNGTSWQFNQGVYSQLGAGTYQVLVRNSDSTCVASFSQLIVLSDPPAPVIGDIQISDPSDCANMDGQIHITAIGGTGNYEYSINGTDWKTNGLFTDLASGLYTVQIRNLEGSCVVSTSPIAILATGSPEISQVDVTQPADCGTIGGTINISITGNATDYLYSIDNGQNWFALPDFTDLVAGSYQVAVRSSDGSCISTYGETIVLENHSTLSIVAVQLTPPASCDGMDGALQIVAFGANELEYSIDGGLSWMSDNDGLFTGLGAGAYFPSVRAIGEDCQTDYNQSVHLLAPASPDILGVQFQHPTDCNQANGSIAIVAQGGNGDLVYSIDGGSTWSGSADFALLAAGSYQVLVRNADGSCLSEYAQTIELLAPENPQLNEIAILSIGSCEAALASLQIYADGGQAPLQYTIDGGHTWQTNGGLYTNLPLGTFLTGVRNADGSCPVYTENPVSIHTTTSPEIIAVDIQHPSACETGDGTIGLEVIGGTGNYEYSIDGGQEWSSNPIFTALLPGSYTIQVRNDDGSCTVVYHSPVMLDGGIVPMISSLDFTDPSACGLADGSISIEATGSVGVPLAYTINAGFSWSNEIPTVSDLEAGIYFVGVRYADGSCASAMQTVVLNAANGVQINGIATTNPTSCLGNDGSISIQSATANLEYSLDGGVNWSTYTGSIDGLSTGSYELAIRQMGSTCAISASAPIVLQEAPAPLISNVSTTNPTDCNTLNGTIAIQAQGGAYLEYSIDGGITWQINGGIFTGLGLGQYFPMVRRINENCGSSFSQLVILSVANYPQITSVASTPPTDCATSDGSIVISAMGGIDIEYSIDNGASWSNQAVFNNLAADIYQVQVRNADNSCTAVYNTLINLSAPDAPVITSVTSSHPTDCASENGSITIVLDDASGPFEFSIDGGQTWQIGDGHFADLAIGTYLPEVRKVDGTCTQFYPAAVVLSAPEAPQMVGIEVSNPSACGQSDASITIIAGGQMDLEYSIDGGISWSQTAEFIALAPGEYFVSIRNADASCQMDYPQAIVLQTPVLPVNITVDFSMPSSCAENDGYIDITVADANQNFQYSIDNGQSWHASGYFDLLAAGSYTAMVRNQNGSCPQAYTEEIVLLPSDAPQISSVGTADPTDCNQSDGSIQVLTSADVSDLEFTIDGGQSWLANDGLFTDLASGTYRVAIRRADGSCPSGEQIVSIGAPGTAQITGFNSTNPADCESANGSIQIFATGNDLEYSIDGGQSWSEANVFSQLTSGTYQIRVRTQNSDCVSAYAGSISLQAPNAPYISALTPTNPSDCELEDGVITILANGGEYLQFSIDSGNSWHVNGGQFHNLPTGNYFPAIRKADGSCAVYYAEMVSLQLADAPQIMAVETQPVSDCDQADGSISIQATGGTNPEYSIDGGQSWQSTPTFTNLPAALYTVSIRNEDNSCQFTQHSVINLNPPGAPVVQDVLVDLPSDCASADGTITIVTTGDQDDLQFSIDGGQSWFANGGVFDQLVMGAYQIMVSKADGSCPFNYGSPLVLLAPNAPLIAGIDLSNPTPCGSPDGQISINAVGTGTLEYSIDGGESWSANTGVFINLAGGAYSVSVRNLDGSCQIDYPYAVTLGTPSAVQLVSVAATDPSACASQDGSIHITASGSGSLRYSVDDGETWYQEPVFDQLDAGNYTVVVSNANGSCPVIYSETVSLYGPESLSPADISISTDAGCGDETGFILITPPAGFADLVYSIDNGETFSANGNFTGLAPGDYQILIQDNSINCPATFTQSVNIVDGVLPVIEDVQSIRPTNCFTDNGSIDIFVSGGSSSLEYSIDGGLTWTSESNFAALSVGIYSVVVRNEGGSCHSEYVNVELVPPFAPTVGEVEVTQLSDCGAQDAVIQIIGEGGPADREFTINGGLDWFPDSTFTDLPAGEYIVGIRTLSIGCEIYQQSPVNIEPLLEPEILEVTFTPPTDCNSNDGSLSVTMANEEIYYQISINNGGTWLVQTEFANLGPGTYQVLARNLVGNCMVAYEEPIELEAPLGFSVDDIVSASPTDCDATDGSILFVLPNANGLSFSVDGGTSWQDAASFENLPVGTYQPMVRNNNSVNCALGFAEIELVAPFVSAVDSIDVIQPIDCGNGLGTLVIYSGTSETRQYSIDGGLNWQSETTFYNVPIGIHTLQISDENLACTESWSTQVWILPATDPLVEDIQVSDATACTADDGSIALAINDNASSSLRFYLAESELWQSAPTFHDLSPGTYHILAEDSLNGCEFWLEDITLGGFDTLAVQIDTMLAPSCNAEADGMVFLSTTGGDGSYAYLWSNESQGPELTNVSGGSYWVSVTDGRGCTEEMMVEVPESALFAATAQELADTVICGEQEITYDFSDLEDVSFNWTSDNGFTATEAVVQIRESGTYWVSILNEEGCIVQDTFTVNSLDTEFAVDFLLPAEAVMNEPVVAIDITWPIPDQIEWIYDTDQIEQVGTYENQEIMSFPAPGTYSIGLRASHGECSGYLEKEIQIFETADSLHNQLDTTSLSGIREFSIYPNPNDGHFMAKVILLSPQAVTLWIFQQDGKLIERRDLTGATNYLESYTLPHLESGVYTAVAQTFDSWIYFNFVIH